LARACNISSPSVSLWLSGETKELEAGNLLNAARYLGVSPFWLQFGEGSMTEGAPSTASPGSPGLALQTLQRCLAQLPPSRREAIGVLLPRLASDPQPHWVAPLDALFTAP
jgi:transcriptional regulator with XRE-family HTH domain